MSNNERIIQIPVLFDMSGSSVVFGEEVAGDFVDSHLQFLLDMTTEANGISLNASDISSSILIGDSDNSDNLFFDGDSNGLGVDNLCNRIAKAITRGKLVHVPSIGNFSNSGIPIGGEKYLYNNLGQIQDPGSYTKKYTPSIAPIGDEQMLGQAMARVASVHLIGDPLGSQAFEDSTSIQTYLETASTQTFNQGRTAFYNALAVQLSKVLGGSKSSATLNPGLLVGTEQYSTSYDLVTTSLIPDLQPGSQLTGQVYTASSEYNTSTYAAARAFNTTYNTYWATTSGTYTNGTGSYNSSTMMGNINNVTTNSNVWNGMWIKADLGETVVLSEYKIYPYQHNNYGSAPRHGYFLSSPDGINWYQIHELDITDDAAGRLLYKDANNNYIPVTIDLTSLNNRAGRYFALVIDKIFSSAGLNYCIIKELQLNGVTKAEFDGGSPPTAYDVGSGKANSAYSASSNYHTTHYRPHEAFDGDTGGGYGWLSLNNSFISSTGELNNASTHKLASGLAGEWIQVDLSQNVNVMKIHLVGAGDGKDYPMEGYLLSSKDKINWDIVHTLNSNNWVEGTSFDDYIVDISGTPTGEEDIKIGSSWRLVITKTTTTNNGYLRLFNFQLNGIVFPTDFGSAPSTTNETFTNNVTPYDITTWNTDEMINHSIITNQHYSSSSRDNTTTYSHGSAFRDDGESSWRTETTLYNTTDGLHQHNTWTGPYRGEWIQVDLSENFLVKNYLIEGFRSTYGPYYKSSPKKGYLLSSLDNKRWRLAHTFDISSNDAREYYNATDKYNSIFNDISNNELSVGRYWRFVTEKVFPGNEGYLNIMNFKLFGVKETEETKNNGQSTTTFVDDYTLTVTPYDLTSNKKSGENNVESDLSGVYTASSISTSGYQPYKAFEGPSSMRWRSHVNHYNSTGTYYGSHATGPYRGEWIQVDVGETVFADNYIVGGYEYAGNHLPYINSSPKKGYLLSSLDGEKWRLAHTFEETTANADYVYTSNDGLGVAYRDISNNENAIGRYWRFVVEKLFGTGPDQGATLCKLKINGGKFPSEVTQGDITTTTQDNTIYTLNATPYDLTTHTITGAEASWGTFNPPSDLSGVYSSSSYADTGHLSKEAFTTSHSTYAWRSISSVYNAAQGTYYGSHMSGPYKGEWIQVDVGETVFAYNYLIGGYKNSHNAYRNSSPKKGYLLSSLDGNTWRLVHTFEETSDAGDYAHNDTSGNGVRINNITNNKNAIGRYWRFVIEKVFASNEGYTHMTHFKIDGVKYPSEVNVGNGAETTTIKNYTLTETPYDFSSVDNAGVSLIQLPVRSENLNNRFSSSSYSTASYLPKNAFAGYSNYNWRCYSTPYNGTSGLYYGVHKTGPYYGEWIQVDLSENYIASSYVLQGFPSNHGPYKNSSPKKGYLLSSLDGKNWRLAHTFEETTDNADYVYTTTTLNGIKYNEITCNDYAIGRYWRFVVEKVFPSNDSYVNICMLTLYGVKESQKIEGVVSTDISNNNPGYVFNVTPYDITNEFSVLTGHEYSASSVHTATTYDPDKAFTNLTTGNPWRSLAQYNSGGSGQYYGTKFTDSYKGEWIQVDLSENVFADSYRIGGWMYNANHQPYHGSSPKKGYLLSSLDGNTWRLVHTFEETSDTADYVYTSTGGLGSRYNDISNNENAIGRYWRFVVEKLFGSNEGYAVVSQFTIMGVKYPSEVTVQNVAVDPSLNILRNLPADMATIYDLVSSASTITGQTYTSSTNQSASYEAVKAFDNDTATTWRSIDTQYNAGSGTYYGNKSTGEYYGEWVQVDVGQNVVIGQYKLHPWYQTHGSYFNSSVKKAFLLSSLDANKWDLVHTFEVADTSAYNYSGSTSTMTPVTTSLNGTNCKGRYFRLVVNQLFPSNEAEVHLSQIEILGVKESEETISAESKVPSYNTFTNNAIPYDIYRRALAHTTTPYLISTEVSSLVPIDIASQNSTISGQSYSATYGTAQNAFDNSGNTEWSTDASSNYGIIAPLITNEPGFTSWTTTTDGIISTFSENITAATVDKSNFSIYDSSMSIVVPIHNAEISNGKLLVTPLTGYQYNTNVAEYDLTSTASTLFGTRGDITFSSEYNHGSHRWPIAFDNTMNGPALFASGSWSGGTIVGGVNVVISGVTYHGHWVQLDVGQNVLVKTFEYTPRNAYQQNEWDTLLIAGSKDGTTWDLLWRETGRTQSTAQVKETYAVNATDVYSQFRWLCEKTTGSASYAFNALEITLLGQKESEAALVAFTASKINDYRITYSKPLNQDNQLKGVTNSVALQSFVLEDGAVTSRGEYATLPLSLNEPSFTSSQVVSGKLEYTFSENLQAGAGGFDITDFQLIEPSGNTVDLSSNDCGIVGGKLVIGTYAIGLYPQGNNYALSGVNATHSGTLYYSATPDHNSTHSTDKFHDGNTSTSWLSINDTYVSGTYAGSVSTATTNAGTINGEYVQIDVGVNSVLSHFTYYTQDSHKNYSPSSGSLVGSKDNVNWDVITSFSYDKDNDPNEVTKNISTQAEYRYYRLIFAAVHGGHVCGVNEWTLFGHVRENYYVGETVSDTNYMLIYTKNSTVNKNIIGATNNVAINSFHIDNNLLIGRGGVTNIGQYDGTTSTTLTDTSTYKGEYIQVDIGKNIVINNYAINVKSINGNDNPKSWMLVGSLNNSDWTKIHETFNHTLTQNYTATVTSTKARYLRLIVNRGGAAKHIKISEFKVNGVEIRFEGQTYSASLDNGDAYTVFNNSIATNWDTSSSRNYNGVEALATNEPEFSSIGIHTDASGNGQLELTFNANVSSTDINTSNFTVTDLDLSNSEVIITDISDGKIMIEKQAEITGSIFYENFDDQNFLGEVTTADIVAGGRDGTGHSIQGHDVNPSTKYWKKIITYRAISFWHHFTNTNYNGRIWSCHLDDNDATNSVIDLHHYSSHYRYISGSQAGGGKWTKFYIDGVAGTPYAHNTGITNGWHHLYLEFNVDVPQATFLAGSGSNAGKYGSADKIDEVRFFSQGIPEAQIIELANGWTGTYPGATFLNTNYRINYIKDASSARFITGPEGVSINNFIIHDGTLISRGTNYGHYRGSTTTTYNTNQTYNGEHINVNTGQQSYITEYELHVPAPDLANTDNNVYPKSWILLGSTNGSDWSKIHEVTDYTGWTTNSSYSEGYKVNYLTEIVNMVAQHYRLIINKTFGKVGHTSVAELLIKGVKHTSETTGLTQVKTASLGTAANAFDNNISTDWNTSATPSYSLIAAAATNEPTFSSIALNSGKLELTFSENVAVTGSLEGNDFNVTGSGSQIYITSTIANNKLVLEYLAIPASQIYHESFDNEDVTFHANADIVYVDGIGGSGKAMSTIDQSPSGLQWEQKVSAGNLPADVRAVSFQIKTGTVGDSQMIFDNRDGDGNTDNRALWFHGNALKFWNNTTTNGTASGSGYLATGNMPSIYIDGTLQVYGTNNSSSGAPVGNIVPTTLSDGNWHNFYIEYPAGETLPKEFNWLTRYNGSHNLQATIDDLRYYNAPILQANIDSLAAGGNGGLVGSFTDTNVDINYTKNATTAQNIVNAAHTSVPVNTFFISNGVEMSRGSTGRGDYRGTTSTTLPDSSTYNGEWIQIDVGQTILMTEIKLVVPNKDAYTNPKSWKLLVSLDNTNWVELLDISKNTVWDSGFSSASTQFTGFEIGTGLANQYVGRYFKVIINSIIGPANHVKINEIVIRGVMHTVETDVLAGPYPTLHTATPSSNATTNHTPATTTTHNADDTVTTTSVETTVDIAATTVTTTTVKTTVNEVVSAATLNTATPSNTTTTESDTTALTTTYSNNDTSVRTVVNKTIDISGNTDTTTNLNTVITTTVTGFNVVTTTGSSFDPNKIYDVSGVACPALKSIYEQLMNISGRSQIMQSQDFSTSPMPSAETITGGFPFIAGDKLVMYLRPKIVFAQATFPEQFTSLIGFGDKALGAPATDIVLASGSGGGVTGQTYTKSSEFSGTYAVSKLFDGNTGSIWITASDTFNSGTQVADTNAVGHLFDDGGSRSLSLNHSLENSHEDFDNENPTGTVGTGVTYVTGRGGTGKALSTIGVSNVSPFIQSGLNGSKAVSFWFYGDTTAANMNSTIMFDTRTNSGPNFALNYPDGVDFLHMWTGGSYTGVERIFINGSLQTIDGAYSGNYGSKVGGDNTTKASLSGVWTHIYVEFSPNVTTINHVTWLSRYTSGQVTPGYLDDVRWFAAGLNDAEITNLSSGGSGNIGRNIINYFGHYAQIAFTESMAAETLKLTPRNGGGGGAGEPVDFRLLVLEDDNDPTWTSVLKVTESEIQPNWNKNGNDWATHEWLIPLSIGQGKYWRLVINKISTGNKVQLAKMELMGGLTSELTGGGDQAAAVSIPGLETNVTNQATTFPVLFPGNTTGGNEAEAQKFGWVGSANADTLSLETTDETDIRTMDLHIWKITITL